jgi:glutathione reductase (NADPH)
VHKNVLKNSCVTLIEGCINIVDPDTMEFDGKLYLENHILFYVDGFPFIPNIPGKELANNFDIALDLPSRPEQIAIIGGEYISLEVASIFNELKNGVHVFIRQKKRF